MCDGVLVTPPPSFGSSSVRFLEDIFAVESSRLSALVVKLVSKSDVSLVENVSLDIFNHG